MARRAEEQHVNIPRLCESVNRSRLALRAPREERREIVRQYLGRHWSEEAAPSIVPVNLMGQYFRIVGRTLFSQNPRIMLSTFDRRLKPYVSMFEQWENKRLPQMNFDETIKRSVFDALISVGIVKVGLALPMDTVRSGMNLPTGQPFAQAIDLDDFVFDIHARKLSEATFVGHRIRVPIDVVKDSRIYSQARRRLEPTTDQPYNLEGDERISMLGRTYYGMDAQEFLDFVDIWEFYIPHQRLILTLASDASGAPSSEEDPLRETEWVGPDQGPIHYLGYGTVPGNAMPKGPAQDLIDIHVQGNNVWRKLFRQAERSKDNVFVQAGSTEDGDRVIQANDGDIVRVDNPQNLKVVQGVGPNQNLQQFAIGLNNLFSRMAGNLDALGGLAPQTSTFHGDELLEQSATGSISEMQDITVKHVSEVAKSILWYDWHHPEQVMTTEYSVPGVPQLTRPRHLTPQLRQMGKFEDLDIRVDPYSMQHKSPQQQAAALTELVTKIVLPMQQLLQQQGIMFDLNAYFQKIGKYQDMPDLSDLLSVQEPVQQQPAQAGGGGPGMPAQTERKYVRENRPMKTGQGQDQVLQQALLNHNPGGASRNGQPA